jgi:hypothetical protein
MRIRQTIIVLTFLAIFFSCQSNSKKKVDDDLVQRQRSFVDELYLPPVTPWANSSDSNLCQRESDWLYLHMEELKKKTGLNFLQRLNLQYQLNFLWNQKKPLEASASSQKFVSPQYSQKLQPADRLTLLEQSLERVNGGVNFWNIPEGVYTYWFIDWDLISKNQPLDFLSKIIALPEIKEVIPVLISRCFSSFTIHSQLESRPELLSFSFVLGVESMTAFKEGEELPLSPLRHPLEAYFSDLGKITWVYPEAFNNKLKKNQIAVEGMVYRTLYY